MQITQKNQKVYDAIKRAGLLNGDMSFTGENRTFHNGMMIDLIPERSRGINVRSSLCNSDWLLIREIVLARANYTCEICKETQLKLHCHERFSYDNNKGIQKLENFGCICEKCHNAIHYGYASVVGKEKEAMNHFISQKFKEFWEVEEETKEMMFRLELNKAVEEWDERSKIEYTLDLSILSNSGFTIIDEDKKQQRERYEKRFLDIEIGKNIYHIKHKHWDTGTKHYIYIDEDNAEEKNIGIFNLTKNNIFYPNQQCSVPKDDLKPLIAELRKILSLPLMQ